MTNGRTDHLNHWRLILATGVLACGLLGFGFFLRTLSVNDRTYRLCQRIHTLAVAPSELKPGQPGYTYYHDLAPPEENEARKNAQTLLADLFADCEDFR